MIPADWTPHRRDDGELVGWIRPADDGELWVPIDLLGREDPDAYEWLDAEAVLEERGIAWLGEIWMLEQGGVARRVRLVEVNPDRVVVQTDDYGAIDAPVERFVLPWPAPATLRPRRPGDPDGREAWAAPAADAPAADGPAAD